MAPATRAARTFVSRLNGQGEQRQQLSPLWDNRPARPRPCHSGPDPGRPGPNRRRVRSSCLERRGRTSPLRARSHAHRAERVSISTLQFRKRTSQRRGESGRGDDRTTLLWRGEVKASIVRGRKRAASTADRVTKQLVLDDNVGWKFFWQLRNSIREFPTFFSNLENRKRAFFFF